MSDHAYNVAAFRCDLLSLENDFRGMATKMQLVRSEQVAERLQKAEPAKLEQCAYRLRERSKIMDQLIRDTNADLSGLYP